MYIRGYTPFMDPRRSNQALHGNRRFNLTPEPMRGNFSAMISATIRTSSPFRPEAENPSRVSTLPGYFSPCLPLVNDVQMNRTAHSVPDGEVLQIGANHSTSLRGELNASKMSFVQIQNDLFTSFGGRARLPGLRECLGQDDYGAGAEHLNLLAKGSMWAFSMFLHTLTHCFDTVLRHTRPLNNLIYVIGSYDIGRTPAKFDFKALKPLQPHSATIQPWSPKNA